MQTLHSVVASSKISSTNLSISLVQFEKSNMAFELVKKRVERVKKENISSPPQSQCH